MPRGITKASVPADTDEITSVTVIADTNPCPCPTPDPTTVAPATPALAAVQAKMATISAAPPAPVPLVDPMNTKHLRYRSHSNPNKVVLGTEEVVNNPNWTPIDAQGRDLRPVMVDGKVMLSGDPASYSQIPSERLSFMSAASIDVLRGILFGAGIPNVLAAKGVRKPIIDQSLTRADLHNAVLELELARETLNRRKAQPASIAA